MKTLKDIVGDRYRGTVEYLFSILLRQLNGFNKYEGEEFPVGCNFCGETICDLECTGFSRDRPNLLTLWLNKKYEETKGKKHTLYSPDITKDE